MSTQTGADRIEQFAFGFMASKVLFAAIEFGVFTELAKQPLDGQTRTERLRLHPRSVARFPRCTGCIGDARTAGKCVRKPQRLISISTAPNRYTSQTFSKCGIYGLSVLGLLADGLRTGKLC